MGNINTTMEGEAEGELKVKLVPNKFQVIKGHNIDDFELFDYRESQGDELVPPKEEEQSLFSKPKEKSTKSKKSKSKRKAKSSKKDKKKKTAKNKKKIEEDLEQKKNKDQEKKPSNRIKRIEDYFQWDSITEEQKDMYYDFIVTAKNTWNDNGYDDEEVRKVVLEKVALLRFCIARDFNPKKTYEMWIKWVEWRLEYQPHKIRRKEIKDSSITKCFYINEQNKRGCPCIVISPGATTETYDINLMWKFSTYIMEKVSKICDRNGTTQMCVLFDRKNMTNATEKKWLPLYKQLSTLVQDYYPERLHEAYVLHMNWFARLMYQICKPFIAKKTRNKLIILSQAEDLLEYIDEGIYDVEDPPGFRD